MKNSMVKNTLILFIITLIAGTALGVVHEVTKEPIAIAQAQAANETYQAVFSEAETFSTTDELEALVAEANGSVLDWGYGKVSVDACLEARDASGNVLGYVVNATSKEGYGGDVQISIGVSNDKELLGLGFLSLDETPGLGMKANESEFRDQFAGKDASGPISRIKSGTPDSSQFSSISGATFTSSAVENALNTAIKFLGDYVY